MAPAAGRDVTSPHSPRIKAARRLAKRTFRQRERAFLAEGPQAAGAALAAGADITEVFVTAAAQLRYPELIAAGVRAGAAVRVVSGEVMADLSQTVTPQGLLAVCRFVDVPLAEVTGKRPRLTVLLAHVRDPGNAGTVLRTADAAGAQAVVFTDASVDPYNGKCVRASAGSLFHLPVVTDVPIADAARELRAAGMRVLAADSGGTRSLDAVIDDGTLSAPTAWMFGNEAWGLPEQARAEADEIVSVPIYGRAESLNLATAAAVCLYASARCQRRPGPPPGNAAG